ncbi:MAG: DUF3105 domain-containing protein [Anaerolineae bacterium]|nr:DUF3105 domain-containing protein [Anaerolineae bacterium]
MAQKTLTREKKEQATDRLSVKQRREMEKAARARARRTQNLLLAAGGIALLALVVFLVARSAFAPAAPGTGEFVQSLGNAHPWGNALPDPPYNGYNSVPPTSGPHMGGLAPWGVHDQPIRNESQVHNLEDGGVGVQYWCPEGCPDLVKKLATIVQRYPTQIFMAPYPGLDKRIALTAWTRIDKLDEFDEARIVRFINAYRGIDHHVGGGG